MPLTRPWLGSAQKVTHAQFKVQILSFLVGIVIAIIQSHHCCSQLLTLMVMML